MKIYIYIYSYWGADPGADLQKKQQNAMYIGAQTLNTIEKTMKPVDNSIGFPLNDFVFRLTARAVTRPVASKERIVMEKVRKRGAVAKISP